MELTPQSIEHKKNVASLLFAAVVDHPEDYRDLSPFTTLGIGWEQALRIVVLRPDLAEYLLDATNLWLVSVGKINEAEYWERTNEAMGLIRQMINMAEEHARGLHHHEN